MTYRDVLLKSDEINAQHLIRADIVSMDAMHAITERKACESLAKYGIETNGGRYAITVEQAQFVKPEAVHSVVVTRKKGAKIIIAAQNVCWTRMARAKEYAHIYVGLDPSGYDVDDKSEHISESLDLLLAAARKARQNLPDGDDDEIPNDEMACFYLAIEILLPDIDDKSNGNFRDEAMQMYLANKTDYLSIAKRFKVPENIVIHFFERGYSERSMSSRNAMSQESAASPSVPQTDDACGG